MHLQNVVYNDRFLVSISDWELASSLVVFKGVYHLWNHRVALFTLEDVAAGGSGGGGGAAGSRTSGGCASGAVACKSVGHMSEMCRLDDPRLHAIRWWRITGRPIK